MQNTLDICLWTNQRDRNNDSPWAQLTQTNCNDAASETFPAYHNDKYNYLCLI